MEIGKYYKYEKCEVLRIFKPISKTYDWGFLGYELKISPGKDLFFFSKTINWDISDWEEITENEYTAISKRYIQELNIHFT